MGQKGLRWKQRFVLWPNGNTTAEQYKRITILSPRDNCFGGYRVTGYTTVIYHVG